MQYGKVKIVREDIAGGFKVEKTLNVYADASGIVYANLENRTDFMYNGDDTWTMYNLVIENDYKVYIGNTVAEVVNLYRESSADSITWLVEMGDIA